MNRVKGIALLALLAACAPPEGDRERVLLVTTTTVEDSGLLDALVRAYHASQERYHISTIAVGSGAALEIGRRGDADILITHDPGGEARFMAAGHGAEQGPVMRNQFIIVGPPADPARIRGTELAAALDRVARTGQTFVSRADDSGTHRKELELWNRAGRSDRRDRPASYVEAGSGMAETLRAADQREAYTLTDAGTYRHLAAELDLEPLARGVPPEMNLYQYTLPVRPRNVDGARDFLDWLMGPGKAVIADHGIARFGEPLFLPAAATEPDASM